MLPTTSRPVRAAAAALALLALAAAVALTQCAAGPARSTPSVRALTVATWNMCGVRQWHCEHTGDRDAKQRALKWLATTGGARVMLVQEACAGDMEAVREDLGRSWHTAFRAYTWRDGGGRIATVRCAGRGQGAAGHGILSAEPLSDVRSVPTQQPTVGVRRGVLCATVAAVDVRVCGAHLSPPGSDRAHSGWEFRDDQLRALVAAVPARRTVYGGDLNVGPPHERNPDAGVWPAAPYRTHRECDQATAAARTGRATHASGHKLDYLFTGLPKSRCQVRDTGASDHRALLIRVRTG
ncbi:endonuclease/exonuclease/phosphatase family protein [Streptomyces ferrugineus]|uniref:Endonuclease/exonuclease/phosphatase family protein n=1 Tax=Streptomyces ferrugineus TaxID=1413221 RepID=A0A7M2SF13_9ACTN|nr:endonuclease/exonuclease/phosphatase family protein [Streptomyces ferrugineus]QOV34904.1 endonuclease/exonuclease/phosphatase family protein [Streptomyces ferrugineus]